MNCNEFVYPNHRGRHRNFRARGARAINVQRPLVTQYRKTSTKKTTSTNFGSSTSTIKWKNHSSASNNLTVTVTKSSSSKTCTTFDADSSKIVIAVSAGRGEASYDVGIAALDVCKPTLVLCQISDMPSYINTLTKINILNPDEILIPMTFVDTSSSNRLVNKIKQHFKNITITAVPRATYNKLCGMQFIKELCAPQWDSIFLILQHKYYCLTAAAALLTYIESALFIIYNKESLKVDYQESEGYCIIDVSTADKLELVACNTIATNQRYSSLYGILNYCLTKIGARTLRATILQPPCSIPDIEARLDCVTELKRNSHMMMSVQTILPKISNIDQLLSLATLPSDQGDNFTERHLMYVLTLNALFDLLEPLKETFEDSQQHFFKEFRTTLDADAFKELSHAVRSIIQPDAHPAKGQQGVIEKCFLIKPGINGLLDVLRKTYSERVEDLREYVHQLRDKYNLPLTLSNNYKKGYHIILQLNVQTKKTFKKSELPQEFIQIDRLYSSVTMKTTELMNLAARIEDILLEILKMSSVMVYQILIKVRNHIGLFYKLCEDVAKLDMIQSLAQASSGIGYTRPEFRDYLEIMHSRHPLLDFLCSTEPTSNSIFATPDHNVHIITGPNGSGKSIFIRQVLLLQVMAQVGCFIPAEAATLRVCDRILARVYFDDNMDCGASSFVLEIKEIQYFHTVMTSNTLIIIDELCRSTAVDEGTVLAMAMIESLAKSKAFIFLATHYTFVTKLEEFYSNLTNWQMETAEEEYQRTVLHFTYSLVPGVTTLRKYGLTAAIASWPRDLVKKAEVLYNQIEQPKQGTTIQGLHILNRLKYNFEAELKILKAKKQLIASTFQEKCYVYVENLKNAGLNPPETVPENFSFQGIESKEPSPTILPQAVYSSSETLLEDNNVIRDYNHFCQEIQSLNQGTSQCNENSGCETANEQDISSMISQAIDSRIQEGHQVKTSTYFEVGDKNQDLDNILGNFDQHQSDSVSIPWKSNSISKVYSARSTPQHQDVADKTIADIIWKTSNDSNQNENADVTAAIEDLNECSTYFTQEWDELDSNSQQNNEVEVKSFEGTFSVPKNSENNEPTKPNVIIRSVHIVNKHDKIEAIQKFDPVQGKLVQVAKLSPLTSEISLKNMQETRFHERQCITSFSGEHSGSNLDNNSSIVDVGNEQVNSRLPKKNVLRFQTKLNLEAQEKTQQTNMAIEFFKLKLQEDFSKICAGTSSPKPLGETMYINSTFSRNISSSSFVSDAHYQEVVSPIIPLETSKTNSGFPNPNENDSNLTLKKNLEPRNDTNIFGIGSQTDFNLKNSINQTTGLSQKSNSYSENGSWFSAVGSQESQGIQFKTKEDFKFTKTKGQGIFANAFFEMQSQKDALRIFQRTSENVEFGRNSRLTNSDQSVKSAKEDVKVEVRKGQRSLDNNEKSIFDFGSENGKTPTTNEETENTKASSENHESLLKLQDSVVKLYFTNKNFERNVVNNKQKCNGSIINEKFYEEDSNQEKKSSEKRTLEANQPINDLGKNEDVQNSPNELNEDSIKVKGIGSNEFPSTTPDTEFDTNIQNPNDTVNSDATTFILGNNCLNRSKPLLDEIAPMFAIVNKQNKEIEDENLNHQNKIKQSSQLVKEIPTFLNRYFESNPENLAKTSSCKIGNDKEQNLGHSTSKCQSFPNKSQTKSIFETSHDSESLFSSPEAFYSAADSTPQSKFIPKKQPTSKRKKQKTKFVPPLKKAKTSENPGPSRTNTETKIRTKKPLIPKFIPPKMLSRKEILEDFEKQRRRLLEDQDDPEHFEKYVNFIVNRPKVEQIQGQRCVAKITKTNEGVVVIPASNPVVKFKKVIPLKRKLSSAEYDKTMFSDKNEGKLKFLLENEQKNVFKFNDCDESQIAQALEKQDVQIRMFPRSDFSQSNSSNLFNFDGKDMDDLIKTYLRD